MYRCIFFFNDTATTEIYTLSLHDALPICRRPGAAGVVVPGRHAAAGRRGVRPRRRADGRRRRGLPAHPRSEEHTSELQSRQYLVCRLLLEKKKMTTSPRNSYLHNTDTDIK